jgi:endonuclease/exonuclease/phosphatase family metal-dependent hydrolase
VKFVLSLLFATSVLSSAEPQTLRVLCWNLHHGVGGDGKLDLPRIAKVIREENPDLVALQEVDKNCRRSGNVDQAAELAKLTGLKASYGKAMDFDGGEYGQAILSKQAALSTKVHPLPGKGEPRIAFEASVSISGINLSFTTVHLDLDAAQRLSQAETLTKALAATPEKPLILCGDFNDTPDSPVFRVFAGAFKSIAKAEPVLTCPADKPDTEIDHVFVRGLEAAESVRVLPEAIASDHRPLLVEIKLPLRN